jgi:hypothetical protein
MIVSMRALSSAIAAGALLCSSATAPFATTSSVAVALARVPHGGIQPAAVVDSRGRLHLLYFAGDAHGGNLFYGRSTDYGQTFSTPIRVNSQEGSAIATGTIRGGQLAIGRGGRVHVVWNGSDGAKPRGLINPASGKAEAPFLYTRSDGNGTVFEPQRDLTKRSYGIDGGGSIAADEAGHVYAAWHALPVGGGNGEDQRGVWVARSADDGATFGEEQPAWSEPTGACGCCGLQIFVGPSSALYLLYRSATSLTHRDIYILESTDHGQSFRGSKVQPWEIGACPMTSMSITSTRPNVFGAWETAGQVYFGQVDTNAARIPTPLAAPGDAGTRKHPRLAVNAKGEILFVWTEGTAWSRGGSFAWQLFDSAGNPTAAKGANSGIPVWSFAAPIARHDGSFVIFY